MSSGVYRLSKNSFPIVMIGLERISVDFGDERSFEALPQKITVEISPVQGENYWIDLFELVESYLKG